MLYDRIPADIWAASVLDLLDVKDLAALQIAFGPEATFAAWADWVSADAAATAAQAVADAAIAAAKAARETARALATRASEIDAANPSLALSATLPARAVFEARRALSEQELQWFALHRVPVTLHSGCFMVGWDQRHELEVRGVAVYLNRSHFPVRVWLLNNQLHRGDDLPAIECANGTLYWYVRGQLHREGDSPAREWAYNGGGRSWWRHGKRHRDNDLPAVIHNSGEPLWFRDGVQYYPNETMG